MKTIILTLAFIMISSTFSAQNTFSHKTKNGNEIILLSEGQGQGNESIFIGATQAMLDETMPDGTFPNATNAFLIRTHNGKNVLVDAGYGRELFNNLLKHRVTPDMIDHILITHMHGDHIGGLLNANGEKAFPKAYLCLSKPEYDHYSDPSSRGHASAMPVFEAYKEQMLVFEPGVQMLVNLIEPLPCFGHTPGHTAFLIDDMLIWGDLTHAMAIQMPYPSVAMTYDYDSKQAVESRMKMLKFILEHKYSVAGMHIAYPGMGTIGSNGKGGYVFTPLKGN